MAIDWRTGVRLSIALVGPEQVRLFINELLRPAFLRDHMCNRMPMTAAAFDKAISCARRSLVPFLLLVFDIQFPFKANIRFATEVIEAEIGFSEVTSARGAELLFINYLLIEDPGNLAVCSPLVPSLIPALGNAVAASGI